MYLINIFAGIFVYLWTGGMIILSLWTLIMGIIICSVPVYIYKFFKQNEPVFVKLGVSASFLLFLCFCISLYCILWGDVIKSVPLKPPAFRYSSIVNKLPCDKKPYRISHFPKKLPKHFSHYKLREADSKDKVLYLRFIADNNYINSILTEYAGEISERKNLGYSNFIEKYFKDIYEKDNSYDYYFYRLKNKNNDDSYIAGFIINQENNEIIFIYSDYASLEKLF